MQKILDKYPAVMSGIPPDGTVHRDSYCKIELLPGDTLKMLRSDCLTPLERKELDNKIFLCCVITQHALGDVEHGIASYSTIRVQVIVQIPHHRYNARNSIFHYVHVCAK